MSDLNPGAGLDSCLDNAFAAVGEPVIDDHGAAVLPPSPQSVDWEHQAQRQKDLDAADKKAGKSGKEKGGEDADEGKAAKAEKRKTVMDAKRANSEDQQEGLDDAI